MPTSRTDVLGRAIGSERCDLGQTERGPRGTGILKAAASPQCLPLPVSPLGIARWSWPNYMMDSELWPKASRPRFPDPSN